MNLRRMNASERVNLYSNFFVVILFLIIAVFLIPSMVNTANEKHKLPLDAWGCDQLYNLSVSGKLHPDNKTGFYQPEAVMLYYMKHCYNASGIGEKEVTSTLIKDLPSGEMACKE